MNPRVIIGLGGVSGSPARVYAGELARALVRKGGSATIVLDEPRTHVGDVDESLNGLDVVLLPRAPYDDWSDKWLAFIRLLEEQAPCVYLSVQDWAAACIAPRLSNRVTAIGILIDGSVAEQEHCFRVGPYWNAVVAVDQRMRQRLMVEHQLLAARLAPIHEGGSLETNEFSVASWDSLADEYLSLFQTLAVNVKQGRFRRSLGKMAVPPSSVFLTLGRSETARAMRAVNSVPMWPDSLLASPRQSRSVSIPTNREVARSLADHRIVLAIPTGRISGVDIFAINLATELLARGYKAEIVQTAPPDKIFDALPIVEGIPIHSLQLREHPTWSERWHIMRQHLEERAPCLYIPNYDTRHSSIIPTLSPGVKAVGIAHSDDPHHYEHIVRLAPWWEGVVGVSDQISNTVVALAPELESRIKTIPYGVRVPARLPQRCRKAGDFLRAVYAGRVTRYQKRTLDLVSVGEILQRRNAPVEITIIGNGPDAPALVQALPQLTLTRRMRWVGSIPNLQVLDVFAESDVFVLPSSFEGLPVSLLEAMAQGCVPVVYGIRSGIPDVITDGVNGFVVPIGDVEAMADRLQLLERDESLLRRMRVAAYETIRDSRYETPAMTDSYIEFFEQVLASPRDKVRGKVLRPPELGALDAKIPRLPIGIRKAVWGIKRTIAGFRGAP